MTTSTTTSAYTSTADTSAAIAQQRYWDCVKAARELAAAGGARPAPRYLFQAAMTFEALARSTFGAGGEFWTAADHVAYVLGLHERLQTPGAAQPVHRELNAATQQLSPGPVRDAGLKLVDALQRWIEALEDAR